MSLLRMASRLRKELQQQASLSLLVGVNTQEKLPEEDPPTTTPVLDPSILSKLGVSIIVVANEADLRPPVDHLLASKDLLGIDIETAPLPKFANDEEGGLSPRKSTIRLVQIYDGKDTVFVFDLSKLGGIAGFPLSLWEKPFVAHNALFELKHFIHHGIIPKRIGCSLLADRIINGKRATLKKELGLSGKAGLKDLAKELLNIEISKELQTSDWSVAELSKEQIEYAALDAFLTVKIFQKQYACLKEKTLIRSYEILRDSQQAIARMELSGIGFDVDKHKKLIEYWKSESSRLQIDILNALGQELNLNSSKQIGEWLSESLKEEDLQAWIKTAGGKLSTSTPTFKLKEKLHIIFPQIVEYRHVAKKISSFGENLYKFIDTSNNRLYGSFSLGTTSTGRMASNKPNMQNMPRSGFRDLFVAKEGYNFVGLDYSQQELRVAALVTNDKELLRVYEEGGDVHANTAASILGVSKESVTKPQRQLAKAVIFGLLYGQGAKGLAVYAKQQYNLQMSEEEAEMHRKALFKTYKGLRAWQKQTGDLVKITGIVRTQCGRVRDFNREIEGYKFTASLNLPIQGAAAEITLRAITRLTPLLSDECRLVNVIHDEILLEVIESRTQEVADRAREAMEAAFLDVFPRAMSYLKELVEAKIGKNWAETK